MKGSFWRRSVATLAAACHLIIVIALQSTLPVHAQAQDVEPPSVSIDNIGEGARGEEQTFTVAATDDQAVDIIIFNFRIVIPEGTQEFQVGEMVKVGDTELYTYTIAADLIDSSAERIEYYIDARDATGNRTLQGVSFDPLKRVLVDPAEEFQAVSDTGSSDRFLSISSLSTTQKIVYGALGVLVVGALIAASSSSGGSGGGAATTTGPEVTITIAPLDVSSP